ncbi:hypothetical protein ACFX1X_046831 [Malus domestica]
MDVSNVQRTSLLEARDTQVVDPHTLVASQSFTLTQKRGRPLSSKDSPPRKKKPTTQAVEPTMNLTVAYSFYPTHEEILDYGSVLEKMYPSPENHEILVHFTSLDDVWCRNKMIIDDALTYTVATVER